MVSNIEVSQYHGASILVQQEPVVSPVIFRVSINGGLVLVRAKRREFSGMIHNN